MIKAERRLITSKEEAIHFFETRSAPVFGIESVNVVQAVNFVGVDFAFMNLSFTQFTNCLFWKCTLANAFMWYTNFSMCEIVDSSWTDCYKANNVITGSNNGAFADNGSSDNILKIAPRQWHNYPVHYIITDDGREYIYCQCIMARSIKEWYDTMIGRWWTKARLDEQVEDFKEFKKTIEAKHRVQRHERLRRWFQERDQLKRSDV